MRKNPSTLDHAMTYLDAGLCVIPTRPRDKRPALRSWRQYQTEQPSERDIADWWGADTDAQYGIGIVCGRVSGNLAVMDCDTMAAYDRWAADHRDLAAIAPTVATPRGRHVYLRTREPMRTTSVGDIDLRGERSYVVAPPSIHQTGATYRLLRGDWRDIPIVDTAEVVPAGTVENSTERQREQRSRDCFCLSAYSASLYSRPRDGGCGSDPGDAAEQ